MNGSREVLEQACAITGLDADHARLLRLGSNAVYRLKDPVVARISRPGADIDQVRRTVAVARWLESADYPAVRVVAVEQPIIAGGYVVTFWQALSDDGDQYASTPEVADVLARLTRRERHQCRSACLFWFSGGQAGVGEHHGGEEIAAGKHQAVSGPGAAAGVLRGVLGPAEVAQARSTIARTSEMVIATACFPFPWSLASR
jgi:hypothetical protein